jgi:ankyrin repeat protein
MIPHLRRFLISAFSLATSSDDLDMVQFLLSRGADPNANTDGGMNRAVERGAATSSIPVLGALLDAGAETKGRSVLSKAAYWGRTDVVTFLLDRGLAIDEVPNNDDLLVNAWELGVKNALCTAAWRENADVVKLLLDRGADAGVKDSLGRSALELAEAKGDKACVDLLKEHTVASSDV